MFIRVPKKHHLWWWIFYYPFASFIWSNLSDLFKEFVWPFFPLCFTFDNPKIIPPLDGKSENCRNVDLDSSKERVWCTESNAKKISALCKVPFLKTSRKKSSKWSKMVKIIKKIPFWASFSWFFRNCSCCLTKWEWEEVGEKS